jgi:hypothetical protein
MLEDSRFKLMINALAVLTLTLGIIGSLEGQETPPSNTNPGKRVVYPSQGQSVEQQMSDMLMCYNWSTDKTRFHPQTEYAALERDHGDALRDYEASIGGGVRGAAGGALLGLAIGSISGDAGKGAAIGAIAGGGAGGLRAARGRQAAQARFQEAATEFMDGFKFWDRHWMACMEGNGYAVK